MFTIEKTFLLLFLASSDHQKSTQIPKEGMIDKKRQEEYIQESPCDSGQVVVVVDIRRRRRKNSFLILKKKYFIGISG